MIRLFLIFVAVLLFIIGKWLVDEMEGKWISPFSTFLMFLSLVIMVIAFFKF